MDRPLVLVTGATGNQGGATVRGLLEGGKVRIRGLTRDPASAKGKALAGKGVEVVAGDFDDRASLDRALVGVDGAFVVSTMMGTSTEIETRQGITVLEAAEAAGTAHVVYTSVDGAERATGIPHFESKWKVERRLGEIGLSSTVLRPVLFMDMLAGAGRGTGVFLGLLRAALGDQPIQMVATTDIGWFAARALEDPTAYRGRTVGIAGDELTVPQIAATFAKVRGKAPWTVPIPRMGLRLLPRDLRLMMIWFGEHGYTVDLEAVRREHPGVRTLAQAL